MERTSVKDGATIAIFDDVAFMRQLIRSKFRTYGFDVLGFNDGLFVRPDRARCDISLFVVDVNMRHGGIKLVKRLKKDAKYARSAFCVISSCNQPETRADAEEAGCDLFLTKPLNWEALEAFLVERGLIQ